MEGKIAKNSLIQEKFKRWHTFLSLPCLLQVQFRTELTNWQYLLTVTSKKYHCQLCNRKQLGKDLERHLIGKRHKIRTESIVEMYHPKYLSDKSCTVLSISVDGVAIQYLNNLPEDDDHFSDAHSSGISSESCTEENITCLEVYSNAECSMNKDSLSPSEDNNLFKQVYTELDVEQLLHIRFKKELLGWRYMLTKYKGIYVCNLCGGLKLNDFIEVQMHIRDVVHSENLKDVSTLYHPFFNPFSEDCSEETQPNSTGDTEMKGDGSDKLEVPPNLDIKKFKLEYTSMDIDDLLEVQTSDDCINWRYMFKRNENEFLCILCEQRTFEEAADVLLHLKEPMHLGKVHYLSGMYHPLQFPNKPTFGLTLEHYKQAYVNLSIVDLLKIQYKFREGRFNNMIEHDKEGGYTCNLCGKLSLQWIDDVFRHIKCEEHCNLVKHIFKIRPFLYDSLNKEISLSQDSQLNKAEIWIKQEKYTIEEISDHDDTVNTLNNDEFRLVFVGLNFLDFMKVEFRVKSNIWKYIVTNNGNDFICNICDISPIPDILALRNHVFKSSHFKIMESILGLNETSNIISIETLPNRRMILKNYSAKESKEVVSWRSKPKISSTSEREEKKSPSKKSETPEKPCKLESENKMSKLQIESQQTKDEDIKAIENDKSRSIKLEAPEEKSCKLASENMPIECNDGPQPYAKTSSKEEIVDTHTIEEKKLTSNKSESPKQKLPLKILEIPETEKLGSDNMPIECNDGSQHTEKNSLKNKDENTNDIEEENSPTKTSDTSEDSCKLGSQNMSIESNPEFQHDINIEINKLSQQKENNSLESRDENTNAIELKKSPSKKSKKSKKLRNLAPANIPSESNKYEEKTTYSPKSKNEVTHDIEEENSPSKTSETSEDLCKLGSENMSIESNPEFQLKDTNIENNKYSQQKENSLESRDENTNAVEVKKSPSKKSKKSKKSRHKEPENIPSECNNKYEENTTNPPKPPTNEVTHDIEEENSLSKTSDASEDSCKLGSQNMSIESNPEFQHKDINIDINKVSQQKEYNSLESMNENTNAIELKKSPSKKSKKSKKLRNLAPENIPSESNKYEEKTTYSPKSKNEVTHDIEEENSPSEKSDIPEDPCKLGSENMSIESNPEFQHKDTNIESNKVSKQNENNSLESRDENTIAIEVKKSPSKKSMKSKKSLNIGPENIPSECNNKYEENTTNPPKSTSEVTNDIEEENSPSKTSETSEDLCKLGSENMSIESNPEFQHKDTNIESNKVSQQKENNSLESRDENTNDIEEKKSKSKISPSKKSKTSEKSYKLGPEIIPPVLNNNPQQKTTNRRKSSSEDSHIVKENKLSSKSESLPSELNYDCQQNTKKNLETKEKDSNVIEEIESASKKIETLEKSCTLGSENMPIILHKESQEQENRIKDENTNAIEVEKSSSKNTKTPDRTSKNSSENLATKLDDHQQNGKNSLKTTKEETNMVEKYKLLSGKSEISDKSSKNDTKTIPSEFNNGPQPNTENSLKTMDGETNTIEEKKLPLKKSETPTDSCVDGTENIVSELNIAPRPKTKNSLKTKDEEPKEFKETKSPVKKSEIPINCEPTPGNMPLECNNETQQKTETSPKTTRKDTHVIEEKKSPSKKIEELKKLDKLCSEEQEKNTQKIKDENTNAIAEEKSAIPDKTCKNDSEYMPSKLNIDPQQKMKNSTETMKEEINAIEKDKSPSKTSETPEKSCNLALENTPIECNSESQQKEKHSSEANQGDANVMEENKLPSKTLDTREKSCKLGSETAPSELNHHQQKAKNSMKTNEDANETKLSESQSISAHTEKDLLILPNVEAQSNERQLPKTEKQLKVIASSTKFYVKEGNEKKSSLDEFKESYLKLYMKDIVNIQYQLNSNEWIHMVRQRKDAYFCNLCSLALGGSAFGVDSHLRGARHSSKVKTISNMYHPVHFPDSKSEEKFVNDSKIKIPLTTNKTENETKPAVQPPKNRKNEINGNKVVKPCYTYAEFLLDYKSWSYDDLLKIQYSHATEEMCSMFIYANKKYFCLMCKTGGMPSIEALNQHINGIPHAIQMGKVKRLYHPIFTIPKEVELSHKRKTQSSPNNIIEPVGEAYSTKTYSFSKFLRECSNLNIDDLLKIKYLIKSQDWKFLIIALNGQYCCQLCKTGIIPGVKNLKQHLSGYMHLENIEQVAKLYHPIFSIESNVSIISKSSKENINKNYSSGVILKVYSEMSSDDLLKVEYSIDGKNSKSLIMYENGFYYCLLCKTGRINPIEVLRKHFRGHAHFQQMKQIKGLYHPNYCKANDKMNDDKYDLEKFKKSYINLPIDDLLDIQYQMDSNQLKYMLKIIKEKYLCTLCEKVLSNLSAYDLRVHLRGEKHSKKLNLVKYIFHPIHFPKTLSSSSSVSKLKSKEITTTTQDNNSVASDTLTIPSENAFKSVKNQVKRGSSNLDVSKLKSKDITMTTQDNISIASDTLTISSENAFKSIENQVKRSSSNLEIFKEEYINLEIEDILKIRYQYFHSDDWHYMIQEQAVRYVCNICWNMSFSSENILSHLHSYLHKTNLEAIAVIHHPICFPSKEIMSSPKRKGDSSPRLLLEVFKINYVELDLKNLLTIEVQNRETKNWNFMIEKTIKYVCNLCWQVTVADEQGIISHIRCNLHKDNIKSIAAMHHPVFLPNEEQKESIQLKTAEQLQEEDCKQNEAISSSIGSLQSQLMNGLLHIEKSQSNNNPPIGEVKGIEQAASVIDGVLKLVDEHEDRCTKQGCVVECIINHLKTMDCMADQEKSSGQNHEQNIKTFNNDTNSNEINQPILIKCQIEILMSILRHLSTLEKVLGTLGPLVADLMTKVLMVKKKSSNKDGFILLPEGNIIFLETTREKLCGLIEMDMLDLKELNAASKVADEIKDFLDDPQKNHEIDNGIYERR